MKVSSPIQLLVVVDFEVEEIVEEIEVELVRKCVVVVF
jgi:hypothetical protein